VDASQHSDLADSKVSEKAWSVSDQMLTPAQWASGSSGALAALALAYAIWLAEPRLIFGLSCVAFCALAAFLVTSYTNQARQAVVIPILWAGAALGLGSLEGGTSGVAFAAVVWPLLAAGAAGVALINGISASLCVAATLLVLTPLLPAMPSLTGSSWVLLLPKILVYWISAALALAICTRAGGVIQKVRQASRDQAKQALDSRDAAQAETRVAQAETQDRARFMAEMSHEIRTPLNAILGFADTMREGVFGPLPKGYEDYPGLIHTSGSHLLDLVSDLLDISKIEAGRYEVRLEDIRLDQFLFEATALSSGAARSAGVQIRHEVGLPMTVRGDARAMRQIAFNLLSNAIKFTPKDGTVTLRIRPDPSRDQAILEIADDGAGISPADLARIGQPWAQADNQSRANSRVVRSSGLGLAVVKRLTELQGGRFWLESTLGQGTTAKVSLPFANLVQPTA
jgi:signal transduction histidine kinase